MAASDIWGVDRIQIANATGIGGAEIYQTSPITDLESVVDTCQTKIVNAIAML